MKFKYLPISKNGSILCVQLDAYLHISCSLLAHCRHYKKEKKKRKQTGTLPTSRFQILL